MPFFDSPSGWLAIGAAVLFVLGLLSAMDAVMKARTPQGATAWVIALVTIPLVALPLYWVFGRARYQGYVEALRAFDRRVAEELEKIRQGVLADFIVEKGGEQSALRERGEVDAFSTLATLLLIDGDATFEAIFDAIDRAEDYILAQFYIIHDDGIGREFKEKLIAKARNGVRVYLLYDEVGSYNLPRSYKRDLREAGVLVSGFSGRRNWLGRFRLNFRNHRKIVVADGRWAAVGGLNVGDEYLGHHKRLSPWRDTHLAVTGPVVQGIQLSFVRDWYYGRSEL